MSLPQRIGEREQQYVLEVLQGQFRKSDSAASTRLEQVFAEFCRKRRPGFRKSGPGMLRHKKRFESLRQVPFMWLRWLLSAILAGCLPAGWLSASGNRFPTVPAATPGDSQPFPGS